MALTRLSVHGALRHPLDLPGLLLPVLRDASTFFVQIIDQEGKIKAFGHLGSALNAFVATALEANVDTYECSVGSEAIYALKLPNGKIVIGHAMTIIKAILKTFEAFPSIVVAGELAAYCSSFKSLLFACLTDEEVDCLTELQNALSHAIEGRQHFARRRPSSSTEQRIAYFVLANALHECDSPSQVERVAHFAADINCHYAKPLIRAAVTDSLELLAKNSRTARPALPDASQHALRLAQALTLLDRSPTWISDARQICLSADPTLPEVAELASILATRDREHQVQYLSRYMANASSPLTRISSLVEAAS